jgi:hypothetical protein
MHASPGPPAWTNIQPAEGKPWPSIRWAHSVAPTPHGTLVFGGFANKVYRNDAWLLTPAAGGGYEAAELRESDHPLPGQPPGSPYVTPPGLERTAREGEDARYPTARSNAAAVALGGSVVVFGGGTGKAAVKYDDAYLMRVEARAERRFLLQTCRVLPEQGARPAQKAFAAGARLTADTTLCLFGGVDRANADTDDLYVGVLAAAPHTIFDNATDPVSAARLQVFAPQRARWAVASRASAGGGAAAWPPARKCHVMASSRVPYPFAPPGAGAAAEEGFMAFLHGGCVTEQYTPFGDAWLLLPVHARALRALNALALPAGLVAAPYTPLRASAGPAPPASQPPAAPVFGWAELKPGGGPAPAARWGHAIVPLATRAGAMEAAFALMGGFAGEAAEAAVDLNDLWLARVTLEPSPAEREGFPASAPGARAAAFFLPAARLAWSRVELARGSPVYPPRRRLGAAEVLPTLQQPRGAPAAQQLVIFGGFSGERHLNDAWCIALDGALRAAGVSLPAGREGGGAAEAGGAAAAGGGGGGGGGGEAYAARGLGAFPAGGAFAASKLAPGHAPFIPGLMAVAPEFVPGGSMAVPPAFFPGAKAATPDFYPGAKAAAERAPPSPAAPSPAAAASAAAAAAASAAAAAAAAAAAEREAALRKQLDEARGDAKKAAAEAAGAREQLAASKEQLAAAREQLAASNEQLALVGGAVASFSQTIDKLSATNEELRESGAASEARAEAAAAEAALARAAPSADRAAALSQLEDEMLCVVCMEQRRCMLTLPCKHLLLCAKCYLATADRAKGADAKWAECVVCRGDVLSAIKVEGREGVKKVGRGGGGGAY